MNWNEMDETQRDALVVEKVFGWQYIPAGRYGPHVKDGTSWLLPERGLSGIHSDLSAEWTCIGEEKYVPRNWIPRYSASMDAAWLIVRRMNNPNNPVAFPDYQEYHDFIEELKKIVGSDMFFDLFYCDHEGDHLTPELICKAALRAVDAIVEE